MTTTAEAAQPVALAEVSTVWLRDNCACAALVDDATGGESGLADGFAVAARLRRRDPEAFAVLTSPPVEFAFRRRKEK